MKTEVAFAQELPVPPSTWINQEGFLELRASLWGESRLRKEDPSSYDQDTDLPCQIALVLLRQTECRVRRRKSRAHTIMGVPRSSASVPKVFGLWGFYLWRINSCVELISVNSYSFQWVVCLPVIWLVDNTINNFQIFLCRLHYVFLSKVPGVRKLYCLLESSLSVFLPFISMRSRLLA